ncbi:MAG: hypothetical protein ACK520_18840, partial [Inhella sp.]
MARTALRAPPDVFPRALLLAVLVHVWLALSLTARPDRPATGPGGWGRLEVTLTGPSGSALTGAANAPQPRYRDDGPEGRAATPRFGGRVRDVAPPPDASPGAAQAGRWQPRDVPPDPRRSEHDTTPPTPAEPTTPAPAPPQPPKARPPQPAPPQAEPTATLAQEAAPARLRTERVTPSPLQDARPSALATAPPLPDVPPAPDLATLDAPTRAPALRARDPRVTPLRTPPPPQLAQARPPPPPPRGPPPPTG